MDEQTKIEIESAAWRKLVSHFQKRTDVQNIDLMVLAGFCRNCMAKWYMGAAQDMGLDLDYDTAREAIYGMTYDQWKADFQQKATSEQLERFNNISKDDLTE